MTEKELFWKEQRISYWEKFHAVPSMNEMLCDTEAYQEVGI